MNKFSHYISELSSISNRTQELLAEKEGKLQEDVQYNNLVRQQKIEEKEQAIEDELLSFRKNINKLKAERLRGLRDAEEEINKSISDIEEQEKRADIRWKNINNNIMEYRHKMTKKLCILSFSLTSFIFFCGTLCWAVIEGGVDDFLWAVLPLCGGYSILFTFNAIMICLVSTRTTKTPKLR